MIEHMLDTEFQWQALPPYFPSCTTVQNYFYALRDEGVYNRMMDRLHACGRGLAGRSVLPSAFLVDAPDRLEGFGVLFGPIRGFSGVAGDGGVRIMSRRSDQQDEADRLDSAGIAMLFD